VSRNFKWVQPYPLVTMKTNIFAGLCTPINLFMAIINIFPLPPLPYKCFVCKWKCWHFWMTPNNFLWFTALDIFSALDIQSNDIWSFIIFLISLYFIISIPTQFIQAWPTSFNPTSKLDYNVESQLNEMKPLTEFQRAHLLDMIYKEATKFTM